MDGGWVSGTMTAEVRVIRVGGRPSLGCLG